MKVVFDTNVLISAFLTETGPSQVVLSRALRRHTVYLSEYILKEFQQKLLRKIEVPAATVNAALSYLRGQTHLLNPSEGIPIQFSDPKDIPILQLLQVSKPHYLVTGDKKLLALKRWESTLILTPREAMELLE